MVFKAAAIVFVAVLSASACSNKDVYQAVQQNRQFECQKLPDTQYEQCMREHDESYEDYRRARDEAIKSQ